MSTDLTSTNGVQQLSSGVRNLVTVNPLVWGWYEIPLEEWVNGTTVYYNAVVQVDSESLVTQAGEDIWATVDVIILNGTLPGNINGDPGPVINGEPYCFDQLRDDCTHDYTLVFTDRQRLTASVGFNYTAPGGMLGRPMTNLIVGIRERNGFGVIEYSITATRLPRVLTDGLVLDSAVGPCLDDDVDTMSCRQYFELPVTGYDIVHLLLERTGDNITYIDPGNGAVRSNGGRGLVGDFFVGTGETLLEPPPLAYDVRRHIDNVTAQVEVSYFCTLPAQAGAYTVALVAGSEGGFGAELMTTAAERAIDMAVGREGRGRFRLTVRHAQFHDGPVPDAASRPGCVSYGQTRNYTLQSFGMGDNNLYAEVSGGNVSAMRARCADCDWVEATPPITALAASPCHQRNGTTWELQIRLDDVVPATLAGLGPTEFQLVAALQNATLVPGERLTPRSEGGRGYVCCGGVQNYILPDVPYDYAPAFALNLTSGYVRAAFLKHAECVRPEEDVDGASCVGVCEMTWLTVYDEFYGAMEHTSSRQLAIPFGPNAWEYNPATTKRRGGDWTLSIWSLPGHTAEYTLEVYHLRPPRPPDVYACNRFDAFCPRDHYHQGLREGARPTSFLTITSAAPAGRAAAAAGGWVGGLLVALAASRLLRLGARRHASHASN